MRNDCNHADCNIPNCQCSETCTPGVCTAGKIKRIGNMVLVEVPIFVFNSDLESCREQGAKMFGYIWQNTKRVVIEAETEEN